MKKNYFVFKPLIKPNDFNLKYDFIDRKLNIIEFIKLQFANKLSPKSILKCSNLAKLKNWILLRVKFKVI